MLPASLHLRVSPSSLILHLSSLISHPSSFIPHLSSFILHLVQRLEAGGQLGGHPRGAQGLGGGAAQRPPAEPLADGRLGDAERVGDFPPRSGPLRRVGRRGGARPPSPPAARRSGGWLLSVRNSGRYGAPVQPGPGGQPPEPWTAISIHTFRFCASGARATKCGMGLAARIPGVGSGRGKCKAILGQGSIARFGCQ